MHYPNGTAKATEWVTVKKKKESRLACNKVFWRSVVLISITFPFIYKI